MFSSRKNQLFWGFCFVRRGFCGTQKSFGGTQMTFYGTQGGFSGTHGCFSGMHIKTVFHQRNFRFLRLTNSYV